MTRVIVVPCLLWALAPALTIAAESAQDGPSLSAAAIVDRNAAARGGHSAWQAVQTLSWSGKLDAGGNNEPTMKVPGMPAPTPVKDTNAQVQLPFVYEMKRGHKSRMELQFNGQTAIQVFDGKQGWKVRPFLNRTAAQPFTAEETRLSSDQADLDGLLLDYAAKGTKIEVEGTEAVEGKPAYRLKLTLRDGHVTHDWVDTQSFLEVKVEGATRKLDGKPHAVAVYMRDYRNENGLLIPHQLETVVQGVKRTEKIEIERVVVNPRLDDSRFTKPT